MPRAARLPWGDGARRGVAAPGGLPRRVRAATHRHRRALRREARHALHTRRDLGRSVRLTDGKGASRHMSTRIRPAILELTIVRTKEFGREPEAIFWVFIFPLLLAVALGLTFRDKAPDKIPVAVIDGPN